MRYVHIIVLLAALLGFCPHRAAAQQEFTQGIIAIVNGEPITQTDIDEILAPIYYQYRTTYQGEELNKKLAAARGDILTQLIEDKLILQHARKKEVEVSEKEIEQQISLVRKNFQSPEEFDRVMQDQNISIPELKKRYREQLLIKKTVAQEVLSKIVISPAKIAAYFEEHADNFRIPEQLRLRSIFLAINAKNTEEAVAAKAQEIHAQLLAGTPFIEMVEKYSEAPNVVDAGEMGFVKRGSLRKEIEDVIYTLDKNAISAPIKISNGYYIFKIEDKKESSLPLLKDVQEKIRQILYTEEVKTRLSEWIRQIKQRSLIEVKADEKEKS